MATQTKPLTRLQQLLAAKSAGRTETETETSHATISTPISPTTPNTSDSKEFTYNSKQQEAIDLALSGKSFCLTGPAGTGKTTTVDGLLRKYLQSELSSILVGGSHRYLPDYNSPGVVVCSFTNKAVQVIRSKQSSDLQGNCITIHKLLEFAPVRYEGSNGGPGTTVFEPRRHAGNPLPSTIKLIVIEEASMLDVPLWNQLVAALPHNPQIIFIGDIQQLQPVFGKSIFIHAMQKGLPVVELTEVYRQALESPILALAHRILSGKVIPAPEIPEWNKPGLTIRPWKTSFSEAAALKVMSLWLPEAIDSGLYNPQEDMILMPFNKAFGTIQINTYIATHAAKLAGAEVFEIFTGIKKVYLRVGERVMYKKAEAIVTGIQPNSAYYGKKPRPPSTTLDYAGVEHDRKKTEAYLELLGTPEAESADWVDNMFEAMSDHTDEETPVARQASHRITVLPVGDTSAVTLTSSGDINSLDLGYAITVHKSQGSEYRKVFIISHKSNAVSICRELVYTAVTRAKEELFILCEPNMFVQGITAQKLPGKNAAEKVAAFEKDWQNKMRLGQGNIDQVPRGLHKLLPDYKPGN